MPRIKPLGGIDFRKVFQGEMCAARAKQFLDRKAIADKTDCAYGTVRNYESNPEKIPLGWLKRFIKVTGMKPEAVLEYLYDGKYERKE